MARYFFHTEGTDPFTDREGSELPDLRSAMEEAALLHAELLKGQAALWDARQFAVTVADESGLVLGRIETVAIPGNAAGGAVS